MIVSDGVESQLMREVGLTAESVFNDPRIHVWRKLPDRENATLDVVRNDGSKVRLHIKRYPPAAGFMAQREMTGYRLLRDAAVPAAPIIAGGSRRDGSSFIILEDLAGYTPADKLLEQGFAFDRLLNATADLAALLHAKQLHHRDLYLCHFMIKPGENAVDARLIDMARVSRMNWWLTRRRWIVKDLAQFWFSTMSVDVSDNQRHQWLARYASVRKISTDGLLSAIERKAATIARHDVELRKKQPGRNVSIGDAVNSENEL
jgi:hypothetical protein